MILNVPEQSGVKGILRRNRRSEPVRAQAEASAAGLRPGDWDPVVTSRSGCRHSGFLDREAGRGAQDRLELQESPAAQGAARDGLNEHGQKHE